MSIDTYDTLAIIRATATGEYDLDWIERLARDVAGAAGAEVARKLNPLGVPYVGVTRAGVELRLYYSDEFHVREESNEIAEVCGGLTRGSSRRFELLGTDLGLMLVTDHQLICERLHETGDFVLYSGQAGLLFDD